MWSRKSALGVTATVLVTAIAFLIENRPIPADAVPVGFVNVVGTHFVVEGHRFDVAGVNNHYLTFGSKAEVDRVLDDAAAMGANVVRTFIQPVIGSVDGGSALTIWDWHKNASSGDLGVHGAYVLYWDDRAGRMGINDGANGLQRLDYLVAEARKRNLRLILAFLDFWAYTGGIQQMRAWYGSEDKNTFFFADPRAREDYRQFVTHVVLRSNTLTGVVYRDDPTIFAWELANEPNIEPPELMRSWTADMAAFVKSIDPNHLVTSGRANTHPLKSDFDVPRLDFLTWHGYPVYMGMKADAFDRVIASYCAVGKTRGKPILLEEFGNARNDGDQAAIYRKWLEAIETDPDCAGWVIWRLVSLQDDGYYPVDNHDQFDIHNDGGPTWRVLQRAAQRAAPPR